ncbi:type II toxin-antitoxin system VapC family toxin, partial [Candidatus Woesearchaeota archaeon]|nr:type II toxin-antitoxin system VapC family toxin [Candidatus Woesearchaeota archaeon]
IDAFSYVFPIERKASTLAAKIAGRLAKAGQTIQHSDALIAGSLLANGCKKLLTKNIKDFERVPGMEVVTS